MARRSRLRRLWRDRRGIAALEFALVAPLAFAVLFVAIEIAVIMLADAHLDIAANRVARMGRLGISGDCDTAVRNVMAETLKGWVGSSAIHIDAKVYTPGANNAFTDLDDASYTQSCDAGERGDMVVYRLSFDRAGLTGFISLLGGDSIRYQRTVLIQNEP